MLGSRIAILRREHKLSQAELAQLLKISPSAVGMYEQGRREPSGQLLVEISRIFGVSTDYLLTGQVQNAAESETLEKLLLSRISAAEQRLNIREKPSFSRQELAVLFAAMLME